MKKIIITILTLSTIALYSQSYKRTDLKVNDSTLHVDAVNNRVGIGTSSPSNKLTVNGDTYIGVSTATTPQLTVLGGSGGTDILQLSRTSGVTASYAFNISGGRFNFKDVTNNKPLLSFAITSGYTDVSLGNDEASGSTSNGSSGLLRANNSGGAGSNTSGGSVLIRTGRGTGTGALPAIYFQTADVTTSGTTRQSFSDKMTIKGDGEVIVGATDRGAYNLQCNGTGVWGQGAYVNGSDIKLKTNIESIGNSLNKILKLNPVKYNYKSEYTSDTSPQLGFIAQEVVSALDSDADAVVKDNGDILSMAYQNLIPLLTKAIQEQQAIIESQASEIEKLKSQIQLILSEIEQIKNK